MTGKDVLTLLLVIYGFKDIKIKNIGGGFLFIFKREKMSFGSLAALASGVLLKFRLPNS